MVGIYEVTARKATDRGGGVMDDKAEIKLLVKHLRRVVRGKVVSANYDSPVTSSPPGIRGITRKFYINTDGGSVGGYITIDEG